MADSGGGMSVAAPRDTYLLSPYWYGLVIIIVLYCSAKQSSIPISYYNALLVTSCVGTRIGRGTRLFVP